MQPPDGAAFFLTGKFCEVDAPARIAFTFVWEEPDRDDVETLARVTFRDLGGSTAVTLTGSVQDGGASGASPGWLDG